MLWSDCGLEVWILLQVLLLFLFTGNGEPNAVCIANNRRPQIYTVCRSSTHRAVAVKSIRLPAGLGGEDYPVPELKVLHLVRDPRGVVQSQLKHLRTPWAGGRKADNTTKAYNGGVR